MSNNRRHVVPHADGWAVLKPGAVRASSTHSTQIEAEGRAKQIVRNLGGGEVTTHRVNGQFRDSDTVFPGNDPCPPKDKKH